MISITKYEANHLRAAGFSEFVKDNNNSRWHHYRAVEDRRVMKALNKFRSSNIIYTRK